MNPRYFSQDIREFLFCLFRYEVKYVIVGDEAVIYHGHARLTGDIDIYYLNNEPNSENLFQALVDFWDVNIPEIDSTKDLMNQGTIIQFGVPPNRIDLLNEISGVTFEEVWKNRETEKLELVNGQQIQIFYIGKEELKRNKIASNRPKDSDDLKYL